VTDGQRGSLRLQNLPVETEASLGAGVPLGIASAALIAGLPALTSRARFVLFRISRAICSINASDVKIGTEFLDMGAARWRCTDVGTRQLSRSSSILITIRLVQTATILRRGIGYSTRWDWRIAIASREAHLL